VITFDGKELSAHKWKSFK